MHSVVGQGTQLELHKGLVTRGTGALGILVANWLIESQLLRGVVLTSRSGEIEKESQWQFLCDVGAIDVNYVNANVDDDDDGFFIDNISINNLV